MGWRIPKEIKEEIITKVRSGERVADLAEQYAVSDKTIYGWLRQDTGEGVVSMLQYNKLKRENEELKRLIGELTLNMHLQKKIELVRRARIKSVVAAALGINRKNIYRSSKQTTKDLALKADIEAVHRQHPAYGHRRIALHLGINHKRAQRVMTKYQLRPPRQRVKYYCTVSTPHHTYRNFVERTHHHTTASGLVQ